MVNRIRRGGDDLDKGEFVLEGKFPITFAHGRNEPSSLFLSTESFCIRRPDCRTLGRLANRAKDIRRVRMPMGVGVDAAVVGLETSS